MKGGREQTNPDTAFLLLPPPLRRCASPAERHTNGCPSLTGFDATRAGISDLCDLYATPVDDPSQPSPVGLRILRPGFRHYGGVKAFSGRVTTILTRDGNPMVRKTLNEEGAGRVLVIDAGANMRNAMVGDRLAEHAYQRGWAGIVINGCVRDVDEVRK